MYVCVAFLSFLALSLSSVRCRFLPFLLSSGVSLRSLQVQDLLLQFFFLLLEKFSAAILMLYCAVYCHGKLVGGVGEVGREGREGKESWRERDSRKGGRVSGTVLVASETIEHHRLLAAGSRAENQFFLASKNWHLLCVTDSEAIAKFGRELAHEDNILDIISFAIPDLCMLLSNFFLI